MELAGMHNPGYANHPTQKPVNSTYNVEEAGNSGRSWLKTRQTFFSLITSCLN
jgi:hypothetical protein